ncbi:phosphoenolpyruvate carboxykinase (ATP) [Sphingobacterium sp. lm-10]|uniref:phosphoenolpyruvate carboxykinase (ATP) n=1 Tax=Sphingobacterium sp. lm-10 TaxID=2944904 RepID=UPI00201FE6F6|nr:phosphoenolpyruvate carboxykinase (ATP) [Sphingobacterium sp. lm-10]MCL7987490.1 phosphoenolpyruvate carboxykinase (ATP) [Sphingobacterium sp. lm-10]
MQKILQDYQIELALEPKGEVFSELTPAELIEHAILNKEATLSASGALNIMTGTFTGRSPRDRYLVRDEVTEDTVHWNDTNQPVNPSVFEALEQQVKVYLDSCKSLYTRTANIATYAKYSRRIHFATELAAQDLFISNMFLPKQEVEQQKDWTVWVASLLKIENYEELGLRASNAVVLDFTRRKVLIIGTAYTGEIKKSMFSMMNFVLPQDHGVFPMHCSANTGKNGETALFFGLSGTGKTTLSADHDRYLIGDDEHGWSDEGIFNLEGGCYAKCINLKVESEPDIFGAVRFGALTENMLYMPESRYLDYENSAVTENIRVSYPINYIPHVVKINHSASPKHIFFLTADAFGVLPPLSKLTVEQSMYYFLNGYTAKVAGTEVGIAEPVATFSACFGQAFLPLHARRYAEMLRDRLQQDSSTQVWLVNTGWIGGPYGVGRRIPLYHTRAMIRAAMSGALKDEHYVQHPVFDLSMPTACPLVPDTILNPQSLWQDAESYTHKAQELKDLFEKNYQKYTY